MGAVAEEKHVRVELAAILGTKWADIGAEYDFITSQRIINQTKNNVTAIFLTANGCVQN